MSTLPLSNIINVNVFFPASGVVAFNVNNIGLFTSDSFLSNPNSDKYRVYASAQQVGVDFGTTTETYLQAVAIFSQQPNILAGGGTLIIFPSFQNSSIGSVTIAGGGTGYVNGDVLNIIQSGGYGGTVTVTSTYAGAITGISLTTGGLGYSAASGLSVTGGTGTGATITISTVTTETLAQAIQRTANLVFYCGVLSTSYGSNSTWGALASVIQSYGNKLQFLVSNLLTDITGVFTNIQQATQYFTRCLFFSDSNAQNGRLFAASYAARLMSVNFQGALTAITMNTKQLIGVIPDSGITQTVAALCNTAGVDVYASYQNAPAVISSGANFFVDRVFNLIWFVQAIQVAGYNAIAQTATKISQTTGGMNSYVGALKQVCNQGVVNGYLAPGVWTAVDTFGIQQDFLNNIQSYGYYIYFQPIAQQSATARANRQAPLVQIAIKEAGALQSSIINIYDNP